ncbi:MAG: protein kinase [Myxococcus sp.]|nr:protein kinase [Myxococcus sp.]
MSTVLGRYHLQGRLGSGGMAEVWLARASGPSGFEKQVVIKRILPQLAGDPTVEALFKAEARIAARLDHPNLLQVFDFGREPDGALVLVMELVDGASLRAVVRAVAAGRSLEPRLAAKLMAQVCEGLHAAHELKDEHGAPLKLVHRDISPENILLARSGAVKVADFGIARIEREVQLTSADTFRGKLGYAAPEQIMGEVVTRQADLWAVGVTLFELLTGQRPFVAETEAELVSATVHRAPRRLEAVRPDCPLGLADIVARCLTADLSKRWADAQELGRQLEDFVSWTGTPVRSADLGAILAQLSIKPHTVTAAGTPAMTDVPNDPLFEPSTFEPIAELAADGSLHVKPGEQLPQKEQEQAQATASEAMDFSQTPPKSPAWQQPDLGRFEQLGVEPLAVAVEPPQPAASPPKGASSSGAARRAVLAIAVIGVVALLGLGVSKLVPHRAPAHGTLFVESAPPGARVTLNGEPVGQTPWAGDNPAGGVTTLTISASGFADTTLRLDGGTDWSGTVKLSRQKR